MQLYQRVICEEGEEAMVSNGKYDEEMSTTHPESKSSVKIQQATSAENRLGRKVGWRTKKKEGGEEKRKKVCRRRPSRNAGGEKKG